MTPADIVAEALAHANATTPKDLHGHVRSTCKITDVEATATIEIVRYRRQDVVDAALAHLAARVANAEQRAERTEAALIRIVEVGDGVGFDVAVKALREAGLMDPEDDNEEKAAHRG